MTEEMKRWYVEMPIQGKASIIVEAEDEDKAISIAVEEITLENVDDWDVVHEEATAEITTMEINDD